MSIQKRAAAALTVSVAALLLAACSSAASTHATGGSAATAGGSPAAPGTPKPAGAGSVAPAGSWGLAPDMSAAAKKAGLPMLGQEMLQVHYHAHLDVIVDGQPVTVPASIGIDQAQQTITALHTHDTSGILHIESANDAPFTLGQAFAEWGQPLTATQVGPVAVGADKAEHVFVNGKEITDPAAHVLKSHDEVAVWVGAKDAKPDVPASYAFPPNV
jgi:hypothetical protein